MDRIYYYKDMTYSELEKLDRSRTIFLWAVSPIEVHGYHLPVDTDIIIAEELQKRYIEIIKSRYPEFTSVIIPSLYAGANALPVKGSLSVSADALEEIVFCYGKGLAKQGFKYLFISDNHGGPSHQLAIQSACEKLWRKYKFCAIDPFGELFRRMVENQETLLKMTGLKKGQCGDDEDSHAGTNETSLMLASDESKVRKNYMETAVSIPPAVTGGAAIVKGISKFLKVCGFRQISGDLLHLSNTLAWVSDKDMLPYMGAPSIATKDAGNAMLNAAVQVAQELFEKALEGKRVRIRPLLWSLKFLRKLPE